MLKILFVCPVMTGQGGMETITGRTFQALSELGDAPVLAIAGEPDANGWYDGFPFPKYAMPKQSPGSRRLSAVVLFLREVLRRTCPDVIVSLGVHEIALSRAACLLLGRGTPIYSWLHLALSTRRLVGRMTLRLARKHLCISEGMAQQLQALLHCDARKTVVVYNGIPLRAQMITTPEQAVFLFVGRLVFGRDKRVDFMLDALAMLNGAWRAEIIGDGPDRARLEAYAAQLGIADRITFHGWQPNPWETVQQASALVLTSESEAFPLVLLEACMRGLPCISADCEVGPREIVVPGVNGWLFPVEDRDALTGYMQRVVDSPGAFNQTEIVDSIRKYEIGASMRRFRAALLECAGKAE